MVLLGVKCVCTDENKVNLALLFVSMVVSIYSIEIILSLIILDIIKIKKSNSPQYQVMTIERQKGVPFDARTTLQITMDLRKNVLQVYPQLYPANYIGTDGLNYSGTKIYPLGAISNSSTVYCNEEGEPVIYETDEHGFRNPKGLHERDNIDVALIGDSFAQGFCVKNGNDIAGQLRGKNINVLNLGMGGSGPLIELGILNEYAQPAKPKHVYWLYYEGNDMPNLSWEQSPTLKNYFREGYTQDLIHRQELIDNALIDDIDEKIANRDKYAEDKKETDVNKQRPSLKEFITQVRLVMKLSNLRIKLGLHGTCSFITAPEFNDILIQADKRVKEWNGQLHFVYLPAYDRYKGSLCRKRLFHAQKEKILTLTKELGIDVLDMAEHFDNHNDPASLFLGHYNAEGYRLVARKIEEHLARFSD